MKLSADEKKFTLIDFGGESKPVSNADDEELDSKPLPLIVNDEECCLDEQSKSAEKEIITCVKVDPNFRISPATNGSLALPYNLQNTVVAITDYDVGKSEVRQDQHPALAKTVVSMTESSEISEEALHKYGLKTSIVKLNRDNV
jgi:hypothetical protein